MVCLLGAATLRTGQRISLSRRADLNPSRRLSFLSRETRRFRRWSGGVIRVHPITIYFQPYPRGSRHRDRPAPICWVIARSIAARSDVSNGSKTSPYPAVRRRPQSSQEGGFEVAGDDAHFRRAVGGETARGRGADPGSRQPGLSKLE
jgi:hypothetical protein